LRREEWGIVYGRENKKKTGRKTRKSIVQNQYQKTGDRAEKRGKKVIENALQRKAGDAKRT